MTNWPTRRVGVVPIELPAWVRVYDPAAWPDIYAWTAAGSDWFEAHPEAEAARWDWVLSIPDAPFNPYGPAGERVWSNGEWL